MQESLEKSIETLSLFDLKMKKIKSLGNWTPNKWQILTDLQVSIEEDISRLMGLLKSLPNNHEFGKGRAEDLLIVIQDYFQMVLDKIRLYEESLQTNMKESTSVPVQTNETQKTFLEEKKETQRMINKIASEKKILRKLIENQEKENDLLQVKEEKLIEQLNSYKTKVR